MEELENFGKRLRTLRIETGNTLEDVSKVTGISKSLLSKYERGVIDPGLTAITKLMKFYNVSLDWMLGYTDDKRPIVSNDVLDGLSDEKRRTAIELIRFLKVEQGSELAFA